MAKPKTPRKIYVAGPMRGYKDFNFPAFLEAANRLRETGWEVFSPAEKDIEDFGEKIFKSEDGDQTKLEATTEFTLREALAKDLAFICREADAIYMLRGHEKSLGATAELATARALGLDVILEDSIVYQEDAA